MGTVAPIDSQLTLTIIRRLRAQSVTEGGFSDRPGGLYRADATAWAVLALMAAGTGSELFEAARLRLASDQLRDGSIGISPLHPQGFWPTAVAILAWQGAPAYREPHARAIQFLLQATGLHWKKTLNSPTDHNPGLRGWPWIGKTHSWVEPTALSIIALRVSGYGYHARIDEATQMLMDRQLSHGGWNYGNTSVFGQELHPAPESTGAALHALVGHVARQDVQRSLDYLVKEVARLRTPIALGWSLLALNCWDASPPNAQSLIGDCLKREDRYGSYDTTSLCLLVLPLLSPGGLLALRRSDGGPSFEGQMEHGAVTN